MLMIQKRVTNYVWFPLPNFFLFWVVDGCYIPIKSLAGGLAANKEYHNFKNFYSVVLMAMVDFQYIFLLASCGYPGNSHDPIIFQSTNSYQEIAENSLIPLIGQNKNGAVIQSLLFGDAAFPF